eukprot:Colp12_sorted_trinity150504_noHs@24391
MGDLNVLRREYDTSLNDLTFNSKPVINHLTILAGENLSAAEVIVDCIHRRLQHAPPEKKLPFLYLLDSILKNIKGRYIDIVAKVAVNLFMDNFQKVDSNTQQAFLKVRKTWESVFSPELLQRLDARLRSYEEMRHRAEQERRNVHVNPEFRQGSQYPPTRSVAPSQAPPVRGRPQEPPRDYRRSPNDYAMVSSAILHDSLPFDWNAIKNPQQDHLSNMLCLRLVLGLMRPLANLVALNIVPHKSPHDSAVRPPRGCPCIV